MARALPSSQMECHGQVPEMGGIRGIFEKYSGESEVSRGQLSAGEDSWTETGDFTPKCGFRL